MFIEDTPTDIFLLEGFIAIVYAQREGVLQKAKQKRNGHICIRILDISEYELVKRHTFPDQLTNASNARCLWTLKPIWYGYDFILRT